MAIRKKRINNRKRRKDIFGSLIIIFVLIVIGSVVFSYIYVKNRHIKIDKNTFCPEKDLVEITAVLIDRTDKFNTVQQKSIKVHLEDLREEIPVGGLLSIYSVSATKNELLRPEFKMCNPGHGDEVNPLFGNPRIVEKRWMRGFDEPLQRVFNDMLSPGEATESPIMESIQSIAVSTFSSRKFRSVAKRLVLVSDMLQHTKELSHYRADLDFTKFSKSNYYRRIRANLNGVKVIIFYINREEIGSIQGRDHIIFWQKYFADQGAILTRVVSIEG